MTDDESAIRGLIDTWLAATERGDIDTVLGLMTDDMVFLVPGRPPFGKDAFAAASAGMKGMKFTGRSEILEIEIAGSWAWCRTRLQVAMTPPGGKTMRHSGFTLSVYRKQSDGRWLLARDANLVAPEPG